MIKEIILSSLFSVIIGMVLNSLISKFYFGYKHFGGFKKTARLNRDCYKAGIINVFPDRNSYCQHKDHGTSNQYISRATHNVTYVGYWLATATEIGNLTKTINDLIKKQITVTLVFISPDDYNTLQICSNYINIKPDQISNRVNAVISNLLDYKNNLEIDLQKYLVIKTHTIPLSTTAFIIDDTNDDKCRILLDYKIIGSDRENSYGIEYRTKNGLMAGKIRDSYLAIAKNASIINDDYLVEK